MNHTKYQSFLELAQDIAGFLALGFVFYFLYHLI